jgi:hypothetical protein
VGSRTAKNCHPNDGYICSSKDVKPMVLENRNDWQRTIIAEGSPEEMYQFETFILETFDCKNDVRSFNKSNNEHPRGNTSGMKNKFHSEKTKQQMSKSAKQYSSDPKIKEKRSQQRKGPLNPSYGKSGTMLGKKHTTNAREKISMSRAGKVFGPRPKFACPSCSKLFSYLNLHICYA